MYLVCNLLQYETLRYKIASYFQIEIQIPIALGLVVEFRRLQEHLNQYR
jgi:hypothetical protein